MVNIDTVFGDDGGLVTWDDVQNESHDFEVIGDYSMLLNKAFTGDCP